MERLYCYVPDNTLSGENIKLPEDLSESIQKSTRESLIGCFIDSLFISGGSKFFSDLLSETLKNYLLQESQLISLVDQEYIRYMLEQAIHTLREDNKSEYERMRLDSSISFIVVNHISMNFSDLLLPLDEYVFEEMSYILSNTLAPLSEYEGRVSSEVIVQLYEAGIISRDAAWNFLEGKDGFILNKNNSYSLSTALEDFGFSVSMKSRIDTIFGRELSSNETKKLILMMRFFLFIESSGGYNMAHLEGKSSAEGYFQYLTKNGGWLMQTRDITQGVKAPWITKRRWLQGDTEIEIGNTRTRKSWGKNSYETALSRIPEQIIAESPELLVELGKLRQINIQSPMSLSAENQMTLFLSDICNRRGGRVCLEKILAGDLKEIVRLYVQEHHTKVDSSTRKRINLAGEKIFGFSKGRVLVSPRPANRGEGSDSSETYITSTW